MLSQTGVRFLKPECVWPRQTQAKRLFKQAEETGETVLFLHVEHHLRPSLAPFFVWFHRSPFSRNNTAHCQIAILKKNFYYLSPSEQYTRP